MTVSPSGTPVSCHDDPRYSDPRYNNQHPGVLPEDHHERMLAALPASVALQITAAGLSRPAFYPPANRTSNLYFGDDLSAADQSVCRAVLLHSTETSGLPGYQGGLSAPNLTALPDIPNKKLRWYHHFRLNQSSRALLNPPGGVQTNMTNIVQVELVGTTAKGGPGMFLPNAPDWWHEELAKFLKFMNEAWGVPLVSTVKWESYPESYGLHNGVRLTGSTWLGYHGILAHQHAAENDHGDVFLAIQKAIAAAKGDDDMAFSEAELRAIVNSEVKKVLADAWVNADDLTDDPDAKISPLGMILQAFKRTPQRIFGAKLGNTGPTAGVALQSGFNLAEDIKADTGTILTKLNTPSV